MDYDIIGDIHGCADKLEILLKKLGYRLKSGAYKHPTRTAVFTADFIDREEQQLRTLQIVRPMIDSGSATACCANHEFNAIAYHTKDPLSQTEYLRPHTKENYLQHKSFLNELGHDKDLYQDWINWFLELPLWLDLPEIRVVHACWDKRSMDFLSPHLRDGNKLSLDLIEKSSRKGTPFYEAIENILKGPEIDLPEGYFFQDSYGNKRIRTRVKWWEANASTYKDYVLLPAGVLTNLPDSDIQSESLIKYDNEKPLFIGHYWMTGNPVLLTDKIACVDFSACKGNDLMAYRYSGEDVLDSKNFFSSGMDAI